MANGKAPDYRVWNVKEWQEGKDKRSWWREIGAAWNHEDGDGLTVQLDCVPLDGKLVLRTPKADGQPQD